MNKKKEKAELEYAVWVDYCEYGYEYADTFESYLLMEIDRLSGDGNYKDAELLQGI